VKRGGTCSRCRKRSEPISNLVVKRGGGASAGEARRQAAGANLVRAYMTAEGQANRLTTGLPFSSILRGSPSLGFLLAVPLWLRGQDGGHGVSVCTCMSQLHAWCRDARRLVGVRESDVRQSSRISSDALRRLDPFMASRSRSRTQYPTGHGRGTVILYAAHVLYYILSYIGQRK